MKIQNFLQIQDAMKTCNQTEGQTVMEHGVAVSLQYHNLRLARIFNYKLHEHPDWLFHPKLNGKFLPPSTMRPYLVYHDCGKPFCETIDEEGKRHFPNHAEISYDIWTTFKKPTTENQLIGWLIRNDMFFHITKPSDEEAIKEMAKHRYAGTLLITAYCEIQANAKMFGGKESTSYKIKTKRLNKLAHKLIGELP